MIIKRADDKHFTKVFPCGATSDRMVLPEPDGTRVKVTYLTTVPGSEWKDVCYPYDEVFFVIEGCVEVELSDGTKHDLVEGALLVVNAGDTYTLRDHRGGSRLYCVFSPVPGGLPVDND